MLLNSLAGAGSVDVKTFCTEKQQEKFLSPHDAAGLARSFSYLVTPSSDMMFGFFCGLMFVMTN
jgi:hypothetical protein